MAFAIVTDSLAPTIYEKKVDLADQTANSAVQDLGKKFRKWKATVFHKVDGTGPSSYALHVADDLAFTSNVRLVAVSGSIPDTILGTVVLEGIVADGGKQFARTIMTGTLQTYDARIEAGN